MKLRFALPLFVAAEFNQDCVDLDAVHVCEQDCQTVLLDCVFDRGHVEPAEYPFGSIWFEKVFFRVNPKKRV